MFNMSADVRVNTVNCVGVMGKGIALDFKRLYPDMFVAYESLCQCGVIKPGSVHTYQPRNGPKILNVATKNHWRDKSQVKWVIEGLKSLRRIFLQDLDSLDVVITMPALGCGCGGLNWKIVRPFVIKYLGDMPLLDIYCFEPEEGK